MKILILGGTSFVGRAIVTEALAAGHDVTLFSRGRTGADLFPGTGRRTGDRNGCLPVQSLSSISRALLTMVPSARTRPTVIRYLPAA